MIERNAHRRSRALALAAAMILLFGPIGHLCGLIVWPVIGQRADRSAWITPSVQAHRVRHQTFWSEEMNQLVSYHLFVPELYDRMPESRFPVLYWLHGSGGGLEGIPPLAGWFAQGMMSGKMPAMLIVFPNGLDLSLWVDAKDGSVPMESIVIQELIPHIDGAYRTIAGREGRILEGFSMGGYGAARFGLKYHHLFSGVSILAGGPLQQLFDETPRVSSARRDEVLQEVFGGDMSYYQALSPWVLAEQNAVHLAGRLRIRMVIGELDEMLRVNQQFHAHLRSLGIPHEFVVVPGAAHAPRPLQEGLGEAGWSFYWTDTMP